MSQRMSEDMFQNYQIYVKNTQIKKQLPMQFNQWINEYVKSLKRELGKAYKTLREHGIEIEDEDKD